MRETLERLGLSGHPPSQVLISRPHHLDRDRVAGHLVDAPVDGGHPAAADKTDQAVAGGEGLGNHDQRRTECHP